MSHWKAIFAILAPLIFGTEIKTLTICHDFYEKTLVAQSNRRFFSSSVRKLQLIKLECLALSIFFFLLFPRNRKFSYLHVLSRIHVKLLIKILNDLLKWRGKSDEKYWKIKNVQKTSKILMIFRHLFGKLRTKTRINLSQM